MKLFPVTGLLLCLACAAASADPEQDRITRERNAANDALTQQEQACERQFVVSPCLEAVRKAHRSTMTRLRHEEIQLDEMRRHAAAAARRKEIGEKAEAQQARASEQRPESPEVRVRPPRPSVPTQPVPSHAPAASHLRSPGSVAAGADRAALERASTEKFEAKARDAQAHRDAVEQRNAQRAAEGKVAAPLPLPPAASSAAP